MVPEKVLAAAEWLEVLVEYAEEVNAWLELKMMTGWMEFEEQGPLEPRE